MVEVLRFPFRVAKPLVHSYPVDAGTIVLLRDSSEFPGIELTRCGRRDSMSFHFTTDYATFREKLFGALFSTAPTPPLSDEELLG